MSPADPLDAAQASKAWPFEEARKLVARVERTGQSEVLFETGYGPSGLPHIGTFGEVARTTMVRHAFRVLTDDKIKTRLIAFSDDMDGLRKAPDNIPNRELVAAPSRQAADRGARSVRRIRQLRRAQQCAAAQLPRRLRLRLRIRLLDRLLQVGPLRRRAAAHAARASTRCRRSCCRRCARSAPRPIRRSCRSIRETGIVMQVPLDRSRRRRPGRSAGAIPTPARMFETPVTGGHCKLQWKPDWAMRWYALGVDYEMAGKDLIDSVKLSSQIVRALGGEPPEGFNYELFLDEKGQKISKSKGNGLTIDEWLTYASPESLSLFMFQKPMAAKRLYFDVIPRTVDDYLGFLDAYPRQEWKERLGNPVWHVHSGAPPAPETLAHGDERADAGLLRACCSISPPSPTATIRRCSGASCAATRRRASPETHPRLDALVHYAVAYFRDFVAPKKRYRAADEVERAALERVVGQARRRCRPDASAEDDPARALRCRAADPALSGPERQGRDAGAAGRVQRLLQHDLRGAARRGARAAPRLVHRALRHRGDARADRQGAGAASLPSSRGPRAPRRIQAAQDCFSLA